MKVELIFLGGQQYKKDDKTRTYAEFAAAREGKGMKGFEVVASKVFDSALLERFEPLESYICDVSIQRFGENSKLVVNDVEFH